MDKATKNAKRQELDPETYQKHKQKLKESINLPEIQSKIKRKY